VEETTGEVRQEPREERSEPREQREGGGGYNNRQQGQQQDPRMMRRRRKKVCEFCKEKVEHIDYKDVARLRRFLSERAKILPRRITGTCARHQRMLTEAVKRSRQIALIPYISD